MRFFFFTYDIGFSYTTTYVSISVGVLAALALSAGLLKCYLLFRKKKFPGLNIRKIVKLLKQIYVNAYVWTGPYSRVLFSKTEQLF